MPVYRNGREQKVYRNGKEIDKVYRNGKILYESGVAVPVVTQTISTLNTIWEADTGLSRSGDDINSWTSDTGLILTPSVADDRPFYNPNEFADLPGVDFTGSTARSFNISQADLDPDTTTLELPQPYTIFIALKLTAASRSFKAFDGLDSSGRGLLAYNFASSAMQIYAGSTNLFFGSAEVGTRKVFAVEFNGANTKAYQDTNTTPVATGNPGSQPLRGLRVGNALNNAENFEGVIAAIRVKAGIDVSYRNAEMARLVSKYLA